MENYLLKNFQYSCKNALFWKNSIGHFKEVKTGTLGHRVIHCLIGVAEFLPLIGQIISLFEKYIANKLASKAVSSQINYQSRSINQLNEQSDQLKAVTKISAEKITNSSVSQQNAAVEVISKVNTIDPEVIVDVNSTVGTVSDVNSKESDGSAFLQNTAAEITSKANIVDLEVIAAANNSAETVSGVSPSDNNEAVSKVEELVQAQISPKESITQSMENHLKKVYKNDDEIIEMLLNQGFERPIERGGDGRCLFRSIAPQIIEKDIQLIRSFCEERNIGSPHTFEDWCFMSTAEQADLLRAVAIEIGQQEFPRLLDDNVLLGEDENVWLNEFYKDCLLEITQESESNLRKQIKTVASEEKKKYLKENYQRYLEKTKNPTNYAGTTELIAILRLLNRQGKIYGLDSISSKKVTIDEEGRLMPFFERKVGINPIYIYQCWGGGHYRQLRLKPAITS